LADFKKVLEIRPNDKDARAKYNACLKAKKEKDWADAFDAGDRSTSKTTVVDVDSIIVDDSYTGPHLENGLVTLEFVNKLAEHFKNQKTLHIKYAYQILIQAKQLFRQDPSLVNIELKDGDLINVCGDTHGQYYDLLNLFSINGVPTEKNQYLFNGDYVDRGSFSTEVLFILLSYKLLYPKNFFFFLEVITKL